MKAIKFVLAAAVLGTAVQASAAPIPAQYNVTGTLTALNIYNAGGSSTTTFKPLNANNTVNTGGATIVPNFSGIWNIFANNFSPTDADVLTGNLDWNPYGAVVNAGIGGTAYIASPHDIFSISMGTAADELTYDPVTRTLQVNGGAGNLATTNTVDTTSFLVSSGTPKVCTNASLVCNAQADAFLGGIKPNLEQFSMTLVFSADYKTFTATARAHDYGSQSGLTKTGTSVYTYTINGTYAGSGAAVPVPATAWLFGSGLLGLAGVARRRVA
jgi:hypothetical protein